MIFLKFFPHCVWAANSNSISNLNDWLKWLHFLSIVMNDRKIWHSSISCCSSPPIYLLLPAIFLDLSLMPFLCTNHKYIFLLFFDQQWYININFDIAPDETGITFVHPSVLFTFGGLWLTIIGQQSFIHAQIWFVSQSKVIILAIGIAAR